METDNIGSMILYVLTGIVTFEWFTQTVASTVNLLSNEASPLLNQAPVPFSIFPIAHTFFTTVSFLFSMVAFVIVASIVGGTIWIGSKLFCFIPFAIFTLLFLLPWAAVVAVLGGVMRELAHIVPFLILILYYTSPVFIPRSVFDSPLLSVYTDINPVTAMLDIQRDILLYSEWPQMSDFAVIAVWAAIGWALAFALLRWGRKRLVYYAG